MHRRALATQVLLGGGPEDDDDDCVVLTGSAPKANTCPVFTSPRKGPEYNQKVARVMASPAMQKVMGQHASTPEKQALAKQVVATVVAQSPDMNVDSQFQYEKGELSVSDKDKKRPGSSKGGRPRAGKRVGKGGRVTPELKTNKKIQGMTELRRDCPAAVRVQIAQELTNTYGVKTKAGLQKLPPVVWARLQDKWPRTASSSRIAGSTSTSTRGPWAA